MKKMLNLMLLIQSRIQFIYNKINFDEIKDLEYENPYYMDDLNENDNSINMNWTISDLDDISWLRFKDIQNI